MTAKRYFRLLLEICTVTLVFLMLAVAAGSLVSCTSISYTSAEGSKISVRRAFTNAHIGDLHAVVSMYGKEIRVKGYTSDPSAEALKLLVEGLQALPKP